MDDKEEVQLVDMVLRIRSKLAEAADQNLPLPDVVSEQLTNHVKTIVDKLPQDLQQVLQKEVQSNDAAPSPPTLDDGKHESKDGEEDSVVPGVTVNVSQQQETINHQSQSHSS